MCRFLLIYYRQINTFTAILQEFSAGITYIDGYLPYYSAIYTENLGCFMYSLLIQGIEHTEISYFYCGFQLELTILCLSLIYYIALYIYYILSHTYYGEFLRVLLVRHLVLLVRYGVSYVSPYILQVERHIYYWVLILWVIFTAIIADFMLDLLIYYHIDTQTLMDYYLGN